MYNPKIYKKMNQQDIIEDVRGCTGPHTSIINSPYPKNAVPTYLFMQYTNNPDSKIYRTCLHCRQYKTSEDRKRLNMSKQNIQ